MDYREDHGPSLCPLAVSATYLDLLQSPLYAYKGSCFRNDKSDPVCPPGFTRAATCPAESDN